MPTMEPKAGGGSGAVKDRETDKYRVTRVHEGDVLESYPEQPHKEAVRLCRLACGFVPDSLRSASDREWKISLGEGHWVVVVRESND